jgi:hypothetical protein
MFIWLCRDIFRPIITREYPCMYISTVPILSRQLCKCIVGCILNSIGLIRTRKIPSTCMFSTIIKSYCNNYTEAFVMYTFYTFSHNLLVL